LNEIEHWLPVVGFEDFYEVSDQGRVRSLDRISEMSNGRKRAIKGRILSQTGGACCARGPAGEGT